LLALALNYNLFYSPILQKAKEYCGDSALTAEVRSR
jgi:hypothetical protein